MKKNVFLLIIASIMSFYAHSQVVVSLSEFSDVQTNQELEFVVNIDNLPPDVNPLGFQASLEFDSNLLEYISAQAIQTMPGLQVTNLIDDENKISILWSTDFENSTVTNGDLLIINFKYIGNQQNTELIWTNSPLSLLIIDDWWNSLETTWNNGAVLFPVPCQEVDIDNTSSSFNACISESNFEINVNVSGDNPINYQWQYYDGITWENIQDNIPEGTYYQNPNSSELMISVFEMPANYKYRCMISNCDEDAQIFSDEIIITINDLPFLSCGEEIFLDENEIIILDEAQPQGGVYSGIGVEQNSFNPGGLANGNYSVTYTYQDENNCENSCDFSIVVDIPDFPDVICPDNLENICANSLNFELHGATPSGGNYSGLAVENNVFHPSNANIGENIILYSVNNQECSFSVFVNELPSIECPTDYYIDDEEIIYLSGAVPPGGSYYYQDIIISEFNPQNYQNGEYLINYIYQDSETNCFDTCDFNIVLDLPQNPYITDIDIYDEVENIQVCFGTQTTELVSLLHEDIVILDSDFNEYIVELNWNIDNYNGDIVGFYAITASFDLPANVEQQDPPLPLEVDAIIEVLDLPFVECPDDFVINNLDAIELGGAYPQGGEYSGIGVENGFFYPNELENGDYPILYAYQDDNGCYNDCEFVISIDLVSDVNEVVTDILTVFPNPSDGLINIQIAEIGKNATLHLFDIFGRQVFMKDFIEFDKDKSIKINFLPGVYFLLFEDDNYVTYEKILVK